MRRAQPSRAGAITLALAICLLLVPVAKTSSATQDPEMAAAEAANRQAAEEDAGRTLASFRVPPGAREEPNFPSEVQELLGAGGLEPYNLRLVKRHTDWLAPGKPQEVLRWLERHQGPAWEGGMTSQYSGPGERTWSAYLEWKPDVDGLYSKSLQITTARLPGSRTAVRAEVQNVWLLPRSPEDRVPAAARLMTISVKRKGAKRGRSISTSNPGMVHRVAKLINAHHLVQIQYPSCGPVPPPGTVPKEVRFEFRARPGGRLLAAASQETPVGVCQPLWLKVPGRNAVPLAAMGLVLHNVRGLLKRLDG